VNPAGKSNQDKWCGHEVLRRRAPTYLYAAAFVLLVLFCSRADGAIRYELSLAHPEQHLFHVSMEVPDVQGEVKVRMAAWNALYEIRDFSSHVQRVQAFANGQAAPIEKVDKETWRVQGSGTVTVKYDTFWDDVGPFNTQINAEHTFINPAMILLYVPERRAEHCLLTLTEVPLQWKAASASFARARPLGSRAGAYDFEAGSFDALADAPIEVSNFEEFVIHDVSPPVQVVIHGHEYKKAEIEGALRKIVLSEVKMMEGAPYEHYTFIFHVGKASGGSGGGMEHANSTAIYVPAAAYLNNVSAHEFFHLWNVKRIRPASLEPLDYTREMYTRALWFAEGITNTYGSYTLVRTGLWNRQEFYQDLSAQITELETRPAEQWQSAEQSSLDAWLEKYALYNQPQRSVSYYTKGQILGVLLDIAIRDRTDNQRSLDDVLRAMNQDFAKTGKYYRDSLDVRLEAEKVASGSFEDFFARYVSGAEALPYTELLGRAGLMLQQREVARAVLGFTVQRETNAPWVVASVDAGSNAEKSGLKVSDEIVTWNGGPVPHRADRWAMQQKPGDELHLRVRRAEKEETINFRLGELREKFYLVSEQSGASEKAHRIREGMLRGTTDAVTAGK
jgi:predicted metalloprotease with PDZ domain